MKIIDLHNHPSLKPMFALPKDRLSCWEYFNLYIDNVLLHDMLDSQSNLNQIIDGNIKLVVIALNPIETAVAQRYALRIGAWLIKHKYLNRRQLRRISKKKTTYFNLLKEEFYNLKNKLEESDRKIKLINNINEYDDADPNILYVVLAVEGGYSFYYGKNKYSDVDKIIENLKEFTTYARLFYITMPHLSQSVFCNHAYGNKIFIKKPFLPKGDGLTENGKKFIDVCYDNNILIDIKHMSLKSRRQFYKYRVEKGYSNLPIIASHMGITGFSSTSILPIKSIHFKKCKGIAKLKYYKFKGDVKNTFFNPTSINLYDDDIIEIINSDGLIGLNFDQRILGASSDETEKEFISIKEFDTFFPDNIRYEVYRDDVIFDKNDKKGEDDYFNKVKCQQEKKLLEKEHTLHFLNNIIHIYFVGKNITGKDPWNHIAIGSDFDGLIDPIDSCTEANKITDFIEQLTKLMKEEFINLQIQVDVVEVIEKIFYENSFNFLKKYFK